MLFNLTYTAAEEKEADEFDGAPPPPQYLHLMQGGA